MTEQELLLSNIADKARQCESSYMMTNTGFLGQSEQSAAAIFCRRERIRYALRGGYADAERAVLLLLPEYLSPEDAESAFAETPEDDPIAVLRCHATTGVGAKALTHRDYLGSLTALGIERSVVGDILVFPDGADVLILRQMANFLLTNYTQAGRTALTCEIVPLSALRVPERHTEEIRESIASERLDNLLSAAFSVSRSEAADAIGHGLVFVNGIEQTKPDARLDPSDVLVLRGKGKAIFREISGTTRKGRLSVLFTRFL